MDTPKILHTIIGEPTQRLFWCPGCQCGHSWDGRWTFDGNETSPTVSPSLLNRGTITCHLFVRGGMLVFLPDCEHALAGQTVPMEPF